jgi:hypothetical protein
MSQHEFRHRDALSGYLKPLCMDHRVVDIGIDSIVLMLL